MQGDLVIAQLIFGNVVRARSRAGRAVGARRDDAPSRATAAARRGGCADGHRSTSRSTARTGSPTLRRRPSAEMTTLTGVSSCDSQRTGRCWQPASLRSGVAIARRRVRNAGRYGIAAPIAVRGVRPRLTMRRRAGRRLSPPTTGKLDARIQDPHRVFEREDVVREHDEVRIVARRDAPDATPARSSRARSRAPYAASAASQRQPLVRVPAVRGLAARVAARDGGVQAGQRVHRLHRRVGAERQVRAAREQRRERVRAAPARRPSSVRPCACPASRGSAARTPSRRAARSARCPPSRAAARARCGAAAPARDRASARGCPAPLGSPGRRSRGLRAPARPRGRRAPGARAPPAAAAGSRRPPILRTAPASTP